MTAEADRLAEARRIAGLIRRDVADRSNREEALVTLDDEVERLTAGIDDLIDASLADPDRHRVLNRARWIAGLRALLAGDL